MTPKIWFDTKNSYGERIQYIGNIALNLEYWDCECKNNYIHPINQNKCSTCNSIQNDCPSSRENEVELNCSRPS